MTKSLTIYKFALPNIVGVNTIDLPLGAKILCVKNQKELICLWAEIDVSQRETEKRRFAILGTGMTIPFNDQDKIVYMDTVLFAGGDYVWHVYELKN